LEQRIADPPNGSQDDQTKARFSGHRKGSFGGHEGVPAVRRLWTRHEENLAYHR